MWQQRHSKIYQGVNKQAVWDAWCDVNSWENWHFDVDYIKMEAPFVIGNTFTLKPKGTPAVKIKLVEIEEGQKFTDCTTFFGAKMYDTHEVREVKGGIQVINTVRVTGWLKWFWIVLVAKNVAAAAPVETDALIDYVSIKDA